METNDILTVESFLTEYDDLVREMCSEFDGTFRNYSGDSYLLTFDNLANALNASELLVEKWSPITRQFDLTVTVTIHWGRVNIFRSYVYGHDINTVVLLSRLRRAYRNQYGCLILASRKVRDKVTELGLDKRLEEISHERLATLSSETRDMVRQHGAFELREN